MIIANQLQTTNRAEYLLYLWQVEDIIRAFGCDADRIASEYLTRFTLKADERELTKQWYANLCEMMHTEGCTAKGHLRLSLNVLQELDELHHRLLASPHFPYYREMYYKVLPYIVELRHKGGNQSESELQICFDALYGVVVLRLQGKEISPQTQQAVKDISTLLGQLSDYYFKDEKEPLNWGE